MTITINYSPHQSPGYTPRKSMILHNVESVHAKGTRAVELRMTFTDSRPTHDHVVSVVITPDTEN